MLKICFYHYILTHKLVSCILTHFSLKSWYISHTCTFLQTSFSSITHRNFIYVSNSPCIYIPQAYLVNPYWLHLQHITWIFPQTTLNHCSVDNYQGFIAENNITHIHSDSLNQLSYFPFPLQNYPTQTFEINFPLLPQNYHTYTIIQHLLYLSYRSFRLLFLNLLWS